jgi:hypothetical protein
MIITSDSHLDHGLDTKQLAWLLEHFAERDAFFAETVTLPESHGDAICALWGPLVGDPPIADDEVSMKRRGGRVWLSRTARYASRRTREVSIIAGPHKEYSCVLYTAFGGPVTPQEPGDPSCKDVAAAEAFWAEHCLATHPCG